MESKVINLDEFKNAPVVLDGESYCVRKPTVNEYLSDEFQGMEERMKASTEAKERFALLIDMIVKYSDIPSDVLYNQDADTIIALAMMMTPKVQ